MATLTTILLNYNHGRFLPHSLGSVLAQSRPADELIVIDDASTDGSVEIISSFLPRHPNACLIRNPVNQGCFANVNEGLRIARGDVVHFAAADDTFYPEHYRTAMSLLDRHPQAALFSSRSDIIDEHGHDLHLPTPGFGHPLRQAGYIDSGRAANLLMREDGWFMGNTALLRRDIVLKEGCFPEDLYSFSDGYLYLVLSLKYGACFSPAILSAWRRMEGGFASSVSENPERSRALIAAAERRMLEAGDAFPVGYARRWKGRQEFATRRLALAKSYSDKKFPDGSGRAIGWIMEKVRAMGLMIRYRPWDLALGVRQYLNHAVGRTKF